MVSWVLSKLGLVLSGLGWFSDLVCCALPMWSVGRNTEGLQSWEGLWVDCIFRWDRKMVCRDKPSLWSLSSDIQAGQILTLVALLLGFVGFNICVLGMNRTRDEHTRTNLSLLSGTAFICAGVSQLCSTSWSTNFILGYSPGRKIGASLYCGWAAALLFLLGGGLLCCPFCEKRWNCGARTLHALRSFSCRSCPWTLQRKTPRSPPPYEIPDHIWNISESVPNAPPFYFSSDHPWVLSQSAAIAHPFYHNIGNPGAIPHRDPNVTPSPIYNNPHNPSAIPHSDPNVTPSPIYNNPHNPSAIPHRDPNVTPSPIYNNPHNPSAIPHSDPNVTPLANLY
nr:PREDICTED: claudin-4-like [Latimeria chalumnae]|eukprot:XP_014349278.1 PREDICTED: claudin-4-like [Latimeria chalumnae]